MSPSIYSIGKAKSSLAFLLFVFALFFFRVELIRRRHIPGTCTYLVAMKCVSFDVKKYCLSILGISFGFKMFFGESL